MFAFRRMGGVVHVQVQVLRLDRLQLLPEVKKIFKIGISTVVTSLSMTVDATYYDHSIGSYLFFPKTIWQFYSQTLKVSWLMLSFVYCDQI